MDEAGHAHLTDFNIAVRYSESRPLTAVAGSMAYMAPEVLKKKGYFATVDWWSLGIVCYELIFGKRPFRGKTNDQLRLSILNDELRFPGDVDHRVSLECKDALSRFIERDLTKRLGCTGMDAIQIHPWFRGIDWERLERKAMDPPFVPDTRHANFDATHELEELLLEDNPLKVKKRHKPKPGEKRPEMSKEQQAMEDRFTVYDWYKVHAPTPRQRRRKNSLTRLKRNSYGSQGSSQLQQSQVAGSVVAANNNLALAEAKPEDPSSVSRIINEAAEGCADLGGFDRDAIMGDTSGEDELSPLGSMPPIQVSRDKSRRRRTLMNKDGLDVDEGSVGSTPEPSPQPEKSASFPGLDVAESSGTGERRRRSSRRKDEGDELPPLSPSSPSSPIEPGSTSAERRKASGRVRKASRTPRDADTDPIAYYQSKTTEGRQRGRASEDVRRPSAGEVPPKPVRHSVQT